ncbi:MAG: hypothetical protein ABGZ53_05540 [Fuerstiella sp.]
MSFRLRETLMISICCWASSYVSSQPVLAQDMSESSPQDASAHQLSDPAELRRRSNEEYVGKKVRTTVTQRFEMYDPHSEQALAELKAMGFTQVVLDWPHLHKAASDVGLDVVLANWWTQDTKPEEFEVGLERARKVAAGALIGFSIMDEPGRNAPDTPFGFYIDLYEQLKPKFAEELHGTCIEISHWGPMASWDSRYYDYFSFLYEAADVMRIMPYPDLHEGPLDDVFFMIQRSRKMMQIAERELPLVVILQTWLLPPNGKLPEIEELRVMAWQAMLSGAETVSFFEYNLDVWNETPEFHEQFRQLVAELTALSLRYRTCSVETEMREDGILHSTLTSPSGLMTQIEINTRRHSVGFLKPLEIRETMIRSSHGCPPHVASRRTICCPPAVPKTLCGRVCRIVSCRRSIRGRRSSRQFRRCR